MLSKQRAQGLLYLHFIVLMKYLQLSKQEHKKKKLNENMQIWPKIEIHISYVKSPTFPQNPNTLHFRVCEPFFTISPLNFWKRVMSPFCYVGAPLHSVVARGSSFQPKWDTEFLYVQMQHSLSAPRVSQWQTQGRCSEKRGAYPAHSHPSSPCSSGTGGRRRRRRRSVSVGNTRQM